MLHPGCSTQDGGATALERGGGWGLRLGCQVSDTQEDTSNPRMTSLLKAKIYENTYMQMGVARH